MSSTSETPRARSSPAETGVGKETVSPCCASLHREWPLHCGHPHRLDARRAPLGRQRRGALNPNSGAEPRSAYGSDPVGTTSYDAQPATFADRHHSPSQRCQGASNTAGGRVEVVQVASEPSEITSAVSEKLTSDLSVDGILVAQARLAIPAVEGVRAANSEALVGTFDITTEIIDAIESDEILFAVDQQQYLQGYLQVLLLKLFKENANTIGGGLPVLTGPGFVTKENAAAVKELAAQGLKNRRASSSSEVASSRQPTAPRQSPSVTAPSGCSWILAEIRRSRA